MQPRQQSAQGVVRYCPSRELRTRKQAPAATPAAPPGALAADGQVMHRRQAAVVAYGATVVMRHYVIRMDHRRLIPLRFASRRRCSVLQRRVLALGWVLVSLLRVQ